MRQDVVAKSRHSGHVTFQIYEELFYIFLDVGPTVLLLEISEPDDQLRKAMDLLFEFSFTNSGAELRKKSREDLHKLFLFPLV